MSRTGTSIETEKRLSAQSGGGRRAVAASGYGMLVVGDENAAVLMVVTSPCSVNTRKPLDCILLVDELHPLQMSLTKADVEQESYHHFALLEK